MDLGQAELVEADVRRQVEKPDDGRGQGQRQVDRVWIFAPGQSSLDEAQGRLDPWK